jgi:multidrug transporter EmrE-like cation transporter
MCFHQIHMSAFVFNPTRAGIWSVLERSFRIVKFWLLYHCLKKIIVGVGGPGWAGTGGEAWLGEYCMKAWVR